MARVYIRKAEMQNGTYTDGLGRFGGCPIWRALTRLLGSNYRIEVDPSNVDIIDRITGGRKRFPIVRGPSFTNKAIASPKFRKATKVTIKGLTLPKVAV